MARYVVRVERGGPWDWALDMREQAGWADHARFMDGLVDEGFVLLAGPLEGDRETLWIVEAESEDAVRERLARDPWAANGMLRPVRIERWTVVLDGRDSGQVEGRQKARGPASAGQLLESERHPQK
jgi:uncharacterized protein YciI